jgi:CheY-like chemotaxis protein
MASEHDLAGLRLLVVEDEAMVAMMVEDMLADLGCTVVEVAGTVAKGLALASSEDAALDGALLDINVGGEKVFPVAEALAARRVPFVFATGYGAAGLEARFAGVPVLAKPFQRTALERALTTLLPPPN